MVGLQAMPQMPALSRVSWWTKFQCQPISREPAISLPSQSPRPVSEVLTGKFRSLKPIRAKRSATSKKVARSNFARFREALNVQSEAVPHLGSTFDDDLDAPTAPPSWAPRLHASHDICHVGGCRAEHRWHCFLANASTPLRMPR